MRHSALAQGQSIESACFSSCFLLVLVKSIETLADKRVEVRKTEKLDISLKQYFSEQIASAFERRKLQTYPFVSIYLVDVLSSYVKPRELVHKTTLAEKYLTAVAEPAPTRRLELFKDLAETSLYISGFFGDSLKRKLVDIDYYADLGGRAYNHMSKETDEDILAKVYLEIATKFMDYVDVLTLISQSAKVQTNEDLLRLYDRYVTTGSELAKEQLLEKGLLPVQDKKAKGQ